MIVRLNIRSLMQRPEVRRLLMTQTIQAIQAREGIETTTKQAEEAYDRVQLERQRKKTE